MGSTWSARATHTNVWEPDAPERRRFGSVLLASWLRLVEHALQASQLVMAQAPSHCLSLTGTSSRCMCLVRHLLFTKLPRHEPDIEAPSWLGITGSLELRGQMTEETDTPAAGTSHIAILLVCTIGPYESGCRLVGRFCLDLQAAVSLATEQHTNRLHRQQG